MCFASKLAITIASLSEKHTPRRNARTASDLGLAYGLFWPEPGLQLGDRPRPRQHRGRGGVQHEGGVRELDVKVTAYARVDHNGTVRPVQLVVVPLKTGRDISRLAVSFFERTIAADGTVPIEPEATADD